jgi:hypothetical protein
MKNVTDETEIFSREIFFISCMFFFLFQLLAYHPARDKDEKTQGRKK